MRAYLIITAIAVSLAACKYDEDNAAGGGGGPDASAITGKPGSGFYCITRDGMQECTIDDSGMGPKRKHKPMID